jgi:Fe2+ or Zn2+ uptake regulation protein
LDRFVKILRDKNMKVTPQRLAILNFLDNNKDHPTADQIYKKLKKKNPSLSKTTVYNSLDTLTQNKIIKSLTICNSENRYDIERGMHHHFLCTKCGRIYDIEFKCPNIKKIRAEIESCGHNIDEVHGYFRGLCKSCIEKEKK